MAKYTAQLTGDIKEFSSYLEQQILESSMSASLEDSHWFHAGDVTCVTQVFERYSYAGNNRVSMNVTIVARGSVIDLVGITAGGSQAIFFKINTWGEETFLEKLVEAVENYRAGGRAV